MCVKIEAAVGGRVVTCTSTFELAALIGFSSIKMQHGPEATGLQNRCLCHVDIDATAGRSGAELSVQQTQKEA